MTGFRHFFVVELCFLLSFLCDWLEKLKNSFFYFTNFKKTLILLIDVFRRLSLMPLRIVYGIFVFNSTKIKKIMFISRLRFGKMKIIRVKILKTLKF